MGYSWVLTIFVVSFSAKIFVGGNAHHHGDGHHRQEYFGVDNNFTTTTPVLEQQFANETGIRNKRNSNGGGNSPESLLASCQLTNLLLYQALQQQRQVNANPLLALATSNLQGLGSSLNLNNLQQQLGVGATGPGNLLNPLAAAINQQNLVYPSLHTYVTTSTFVTKMTTTALVTVPLLFGNKPFSTTITRTKTFDVTTSEVKTLTSTVTPTLVVPQQIKSSPVVDEDAAVVVPTAVVGQNNKERTVEGGGVGTSGNDNNKNEYDVYEDDTQYHNDVQVQEEITRAPSNKKIYLRSRDQDVVDKFVTPSKPSKTSNRGTTTFTSSTEKKQRRKMRPTTTTVPTEAPISTKSKSQRQSQQQYQVPQEAEYDYYGTSSYGNPVTTRDRSGAEKSKKKAATQSYAQQPQQVQQEQFYNRQYGSSIQEDDAPIDEDPAAAQYSDDYGYYNRRLKRGEQNEEDNEDEYPKLDREYLLEPSSDGDYSVNYQKYEKCPPIPVNNLPVTVTITSTETRTITKFLKGQTSTVAQNNAYAASTSRTFTPNGSSSSSSRRGSYNKRNRDSNTSSSDAAGYTTSTSRTAPPPVDRTTGDPRAQILKRGRSRYNPSQDYEYRG